MHPRLSISAAPVPAPPSASPSLTASTLPAGAIDAHAHVFAHAAGMKADPAPVERYLDILDAHGLAGGVLVQPEFLGRDNSYLLAAIARVPARFRGVAVLGPGDDPEQLDRMKAAGIAGLRLDLTGRLPHLAGADWRTFLANVARRSLHLEIAANGAAWHEILPPLLASGVRLVVEDFGRPSDGLGPRCAGFQTLVATARNADIWFKLSAPYRLTPAAAAWSCTDTLTAILGVGRLVWGSDWPWVGHPEVARYADTIDWLSEWVQSASARAQILGANARTLYNFNKPAGVAAPPWKRL